MSAWPMNDATTVPNNNGNGFPTINDPNSQVPVSGMMDPSAFMANSGPGQFNPAQYQAQMMAQMQQQNGQMRNASPSFPNQMYQTNPVIPSKRPRPREDSIAGSPRPNPGMLPTSRADTPQQANFPNFQQGGMQQPSGSGQPSPYPHLQANGSTNATPSPIMGNNQMRPGSVPQRVSTTSPHPFSPAVQQFAPQASPIPSEHGGTPQPNQYMQQGMQPGNYPQGFNPNYNAQSPSPARPPSTPSTMPSQMMPQQMGQMQPGMMQPGQMSMSQMGQMAQMQQMGQMGQMPSQMFQQGMPQPRNQMEQQKMMYQMQQMQRQQQQMGNMQMAAQMQGQLPGQNMSQQQRNMMARQQMPNGQMPPNMNPAMRGQQPGMASQQAMRGQTTPDSFMKQLAMFMGQKQLPLDPTPTVCDRPINLMQLFQTVFKNNGYNTVTQRGLWPQVANALGFNPVQMGVAPQQFKLVYERNLRAFEDHFRTMKGGQQQPGAPTMPNMPGAQKQMLPGQMQPGMMQPGQQHMAMQQGQMQSPVKQIPPGGAHASVNGFSTPQPPQSQQQGPRNSVPKTPVHEEFAVPSPASKHGSMSLPSSAHPDGQGTPADAPKMPFPAPLAKDTDEYNPCSRYVAEAGTYGGINVATAAKVGAEYEYYKPDIPGINALGNIDLHALTKSLQCGIHAEVRLALDTLSTLVGKGNVDIDLNNCEELLETLVECAEEQVDLLAEHTEELSDEILISPYGDVFRACRLEKLSIRDIHPLGTLEYELDHAVDRLICITTILRNMSFFPLNHIPLSDELVIKFLCIVIRYLGTRNMLLRTHTDTLDFMKDVVILLSNIAGSVEIPDREQAYYLLQFVLAFAPTPNPHLSDGGKIYFATFEPILHPYLPHAIDALAKLFARDEPNRTHYKNIFALDAATSPPSELITRTFAFAMSPIPTHNRDFGGPSLPPFVEARKPFLMQGLLAGEILASLIPDTDASVARAWLSSGNGFAQSLFQLARDLCGEFDRPTVRPSGHGHRSQPKKDADLLYIAAVATSMLRKLSEKAHDPNDPKSSIPPNVIPKSEKILTALEMQSGELTREGLLKDMVAFGSLD